MKTKASKSQIGRPSEYSPCKARTILNLIRNGAAVEDAIDGICTVNTYKNWKEQNHEFLIAAEQAHKLAKCKASKRVFKLKPDRWLEAMEVGWGKQQVNHSGDMTLKVIWENGNGNGGGPKHGK